MVDLSCSYMGIELKCPYIADNIAVDETIAYYQSVEKSGIGAIILKPLLEETINKESDRLKELVQAIDNEQPVEFGVSGTTIDSYIKTIVALKNNLQVPVLASVNVIAAGSWMEIARVFEWAGADAIELEIFFYPADSDFRADDYEKMYYDLATKFTYTIKIPVSIKIPNHFTNPLNLVDQLFYRGSQGVVLFHNHNFPDIDIENLEMCLPAYPTETINLPATLHWIRMMSSRISKIDIASRSGISDAASIIKSLLAGAHVVYVGNVMEHHGLEHVASLFAEVDAWMTTTGFSKFEHIHAQLNFSGTSDPFQQERQHFIRQAEA